jgi:hypothetical protein
VQISSGDGVWAYFGCFLNVYDPANMVNGSPVQALLAGTHHCIVAQIAYDDAPIVNAGGVTMSPENSDKLAQRNLQITHSDNPGAVDTHRVPQTFDVRPSKATSQVSGGLLDYPDELMIDWGNTPEGAVATIYWPQVDCRKVVEVASKLYATHQLTAPDPTTLQCRVTRGVTYIPIPTGAGDNFAGLLTVDLPTTVVKGQEFNIVVRRMTSRRPPDLRTGGDVIAAAFSDTRLDTRHKATRNWRYVIGTFQVRIPVGDRDVFLFSEENTLAVLKWRLQHMAPTNRWYPVLQRYIGQVAARVDGLGGDSAVIEPSLGGFHGTVATTNGERVSGKVCEVVFDCFGDFEGFVLTRCGAATRRFRSHEKGIASLVLLACEKRMTLTVWFDGQSESEVIRRITVGC